MNNIEKIINDAWEKRDQINQKSDKNIITDEESIILIYSIFEKYNIDKCIIYIYIY